jgi:hypothetical protein
MAERIAIVVLGCASAPYDVMIDTIRATWGSLKVPGIDIYYLYGNPVDDRARGVLSRYTSGRVSEVAEDQIAAINDVLIAGCGDHFRQQEDCILRKRLIALGHLSFVPGYEFIYTVCATSYVDQKQLQSHAGKLPSKRLISGAVIVNPKGIPFVSGASMLLSADIARKLYEDRHEMIGQNRFGSRDDVTIGHWIVTRLSNVPLDTFARDVREGNPMTPGHIFVPCPRTTVDYVMAPAHTHRPSSDAFHYHFHSRKPGDMIEFHRRLGEGADQVR